MDADLTFIIILFSTITVIGLFVLVTGGQGKEK